jgi:hypothetical protein
MILAKYTPPLTLLFFFLEQVYQTVQDCWQALLERERTLDDARGDAWQNGRPIVM